MTISYLGANETCKFRQAEISTSTKRTVSIERDAAMVEKTVSILIEMGWEHWDWFGNGDGTVFALHTVSDREEYDELLEDYKKAKRMAKSTR